jgi:hypothetical protein
VAAQLAADSTLDVHRHKGKLGELRVSVDGKDVVAAHPLAYPTPTSVVTKVRAYLASLPPAV